MDFLFSIFTEQNYLPESIPTLWIRKIGQYPPFQRNPDKEVFNYLLDEDRENYQKALANLSISYGIGAYAYFRRIIENEIKRIVKDISEIDYDGVDEVRKAKSKYDQDHQMASLIDSISAFLPKSLMATGYNPLKVLHQQTSGGLHVLSEDECLAKARDVDSLLSYTIKSVSSLKFEYIGLQNAIKNLTRPK